MQNVVSREAANESGLRHYFTGEPCKRGHLDQRWTKSGICVACSYAAAKAWRLANAERVRELDAERRKAAPNRGDKYKQAWKARNKDKVRQSGAEYRRNNAEATAAATRRWYLANKERSRELIREWRKANHGKASAWVSERRAARINATPQWADLDAIREIYQSACAHGLTVDHVIPLKNPLVCGLHVQNNLQLLTPSENSSKGNKFDPADFDC
jgi:5-methylcytosine-specific restriction endonuclease McrA